MELLIQPDDGLGPIVEAVKAAERRVDILIFRFDRPALEKALEDAVDRGVVVRALIAHTNRGGDSSLRKLELRLLDRGVTVTRTAGDLPRYHGKMIVVDDQLFVLGFNYTKLDIEKSRSFGLVTKNKAMIAAAEALYDADSTRQPYSASCEDDFVVSPDCSRVALTKLIKGAEKQLLIYDTKVSDRMMLRLLQSKVKEGLDVRIIGKVGKAGSGLTSVKLADRRLHIRAIVADGKDVYIGSQSLRKLELDGRREIGLICRTATVAKRVAEVFELDWAAAKGP
ncbi:MAG: phospholipase D-like domain-containing protein [Acidobacteriota bacterium]|nr:phospholipase D-like domain-containing protein [Acidobacteriota bacterium]